MGNLFLQTLLAPQTLEGQTQLGSGSLNDAFKFSVWGFFLLLYLNQKD